MRYLVLIEMPDGEIVSLADGSSGELEIAVFDSRENAEDAMDGHALERRPWTVAGFDL